jgi:hypothetical protein
MLLVGVLLLAMAIPQDSPPPTEASAAADEGGTAMAARIAAAGAAGLPEAEAAMVGAAVTRLLAMQEGDARDQWPYEGVYRVRRQIPIGYRVGGTAIAGMALLQAPGLEADPERCDAIRRAAAFVAKAIEHPLMSPQYGGGYDVRGWGYAYGLRFLVRFKQRGPLAGEESPPAGVDEAIAFYLGGLAAIEIPQVGGWNYARRGPLDQPDAAAPFMTAPVLRSLAEARAAGFEVDEALLARGLASLERNRGPDGTYEYMGAGRGRIDPAQRPGAVGRMASGDLVLVEAGRLEPESLRRAVESFFAYWHELEARRRGNGTHVPPYGVAPYYFMYAHAAVGEAIERLPAAWRPTLRRSLLDRLVQVRDEAGTWNDRVFERSANYGTALALEALLAPLGSPPAAWPAPPPPADRPAAPAAGVREESP